MSVCLTMNFVQPKWSNTLVLYALSTNLLLTTFSAPESVGIVYIFDLLHLGICSQEINIFCRSSTANNNEIQVDRVK